MDSDTDGNAKTGPWTQSLDWIEASQWPPGATSGEIEALRKDVRSGKVPSLAIADDTGHGIVRYVEAKFLAQWLAATGIEPNVAVLSWFHGRSVEWPVHRPQSLEILPQEGWQANSPFGNQVSYSGAKLVRLEVLVRFVQATSDLPLLEVLQTVASPLIQEASSSEALSLGETWLHVLDPAGRPLLFWMPEQKRMNPNIQGLEALPEIDQYTGGWPATVENVMRATFDDWRLNGLPTNDRVTFDRRLAIPHTLAYELCGWGSVAEKSERGQPDSVVPLLVLAPAEAPALAMAVADVQDWDSLVAYRNQFKDMQANRRPSWPDSHVALVRQKLNAAEKAGHGRGAMERLAKELGFSRGQGLREMLKRHPESAAHPFVGLASSR